MRDIRKMYKNQDRIMLLNNPQRIGLQRHHEDKENPTITLPKLKMEMKKFHGKKVFEDVICINGT